MKDIEIRFITSDLSISDDGKMIVEGLVNQTEQWSNELGQRRKFREMIKRGAFAKALIEAKRVDFLVEHDSEKLLATTENGTLNLYEDEVGLKMRAEIVPTSYGKDLYELMRHKVINHMSFGFKVVKDSWRKLADGTYKREISDLKLFEVSAVRNPAYPQSLIHARGLNVVENEDLIIPTELDDEVRSEEQVAEVKQPEQVATETVQEQPKVQEPVQVAEQPNNQQVESVVPENKEPQVTYKDFVSLMESVTNIGNAVKEVLNRTTPQEPKQEVIQVKEDAKVKEDIKEEPKKVDLSELYKKIKSVKEL